MGQVSGFISGFWLLLFGVFFVLSWPFLLFVLLFLDFIFLVLLAGAVSTTSSFFIFFLSFCVISAAFGMALLMVVLRGSGATHIVSFF